MSFLINIFFHAVPNIFCNINIFYVVVSWQNPQTCYIFTSIFYVHVLKIQNSCHTVCPIILYEGNEGTNTFVVWDCELYGARVFSNNYILHLICHCICALRTVQIDAFVFLSQFSALYNGHLNRRIIVGFPRNIAKLILYNALVNSLTQLEVHIIISITLDNTFLNA